MASAICGSGWGIGVNLHDGEPVSYGFPESRDPNLFYPDVECCSASEINNHKKAVDEYHKAAHNKE